MSARGDKARARVVHIVEDLGRGGVERVVETLAAGLDPARYEVSIVTLRGGGAVADRLRERGILVERADYRAALRPATVHRLARRLGDLDARVVHGHGYLAGVLARLAGWKARVPCRIAHRHTTDEGERLRHRIVERALGGLGWTLCCSEAVRERMVLHVGSDPLRTEVVHNGVDLDELRCDRPGSMRNPPVLIAVASLRKLKGHGVLLRAASRLAARGVPFRLVLVGDGPERCDLERMAGGLGLSERVTFVGERDDVPDLLARADLFVLPTTGREGLGLAALEAMAAGLPVVASRIGGVPEVVRHCRDGLLVPPGDPVALEEAIVELLSQPGRADAMGREGRKRVESCFSANAMVRKVDAIYRRDLDPVTRSRTIVFLSSKGTAFGGGQAGLKMLAPALGSAGYRPLVIVPQGGGLAADLSTSGVRTLLVPLPPLRSLRVDRVLRAARSLRRLARAVAPQVVHVDGTRCALYALALPRNIQRVWHLRDVRPDPLDSWLAPRFDRLVAVCREAAARRFPGVPAHRIRLVPNAVPQGWARASREEVRRQLGVGDDDFLLLTAGRVEPQKGTEELVLALARLERLGVSARAILAGEAAPEEAERLYRLARELGISWRIRLLGYRDDLDELMHTADLLVHSSRYEAAPRVVLEAMASGLPVVAAAVGGVPEILGDGGVLVPARDPERLADAVAHLARDPSQRRILAARAFERYVRLYTPHRHLRAMTSLYDELLGIERAHREAA